MDPAECAGCGAELTGRQLKYCGKHCRDTTYQAAARAQRPGNTGQCKRCNMQLTGRKTTWCSLACKRDFETESALVNQIETLVRRCTKCGLQKPLAQDFYKTPTGTYRRNCRVCVMAGNKVRNLKPDAADKARSHHLVSLYGITAAQYERILHAQGGVCAVCGKPPTAKRLSVDHDHRTLCVRGLLCNYCNLRIIGKMRDASLYRRAAEYLENPPARAVLGEEPTVPKRVPPSRRPRRRKRAA